MRSLTGIENVLADFSSGELPIPLSELPEHPLIPRKRGRKMHVALGYTLRTD